MGDVIDFEEAKKRVVAKNTKKKEMEQRGLPPPRANSLDLLKELYKGTVYEGMFPTDNNDPSPKRSA